MKSSAPSRVKQAADTEFGDILREVNQILQLLKSPNPTGEALRVARHPAVWSAMKQALLDRELRHLALTDDLTCLFNRRGFFAAATKHSAPRASRNGTPTVVPLRSGRTQADQ